MQYEDYKGYSCATFEVGGRSSKVIIPEKALPGNPWIWRAEFLGAFDTVDMALVKKGWHLAYHGVSNMFGCPESIVMMKEFYDFVLKEFSLDPKPVIFGFSRGGLYTVNFAKTHPDCVMALYLDAPVTDVRSWPGGFGAGCGSDWDWNECKKWYHLDDESSKSFAQNPNDAAKDIAAAGIPVIIVAGGADHVVPFVENGKIFAANYSEVNPKNIRVIVKENCDHHPHSLEDPTPVVAFIEKIRG